MCIIRAFRSTEKAVMNDEALSRWWRSLSPAAREQLQRDPYAPIPANLAKQVVRSSLVLLRTYWPDTYPAGPSFRLPDNIAEWVRALPSRDQAQTAGSRATAAPLTARH
jgi:hypothetical protein